MVKTPGQDDLTVDSKNDTFASKGYVFNLTGTDNTLSFIFFVTCYLSL